MHLGHAHPAAPTRAQVVKEGVAVRVTKRQRNQRRSRPASGFTVWMHDQHADRSACLQAVNDADEAARGTYIDWLRDKHDVYNSSTPGEKYVWQSKAEAEWEKEYANECNDDSQSCHVIDSMRGETTVETVLQKIQDARSPISEFVYAISMRNICGVTSDSPLQGFYRFTKEARRQ